MKSKLFMTRIVLVLSTLILIGCEPEKSQDTALDIGCDEFKKNQHISKEIEVANGSSFEVSLCSNPSTGFKWEPVQISDLTVLEEMNHRFVSPEENDTPPPPGTAGKEVWTFKALKEGKSTIFIAYSQSWKDGEKSAWTYELTVLAD